MKIAISLLFVKVGKSGGVESFIRNLLDGLKEVDQTNVYVLIVTRDTAETFKKYIGNNFSMIIADIDSEPVSKRLLWENMFFNRLLIKNGISNCIQPTYQKPWIKDKRIRYITVIHDLQQLHFPEYFSKKRYYWAKVGWLRAIKTSQRIIAISDYVKKDIVERLNANSDMISVIHNPIIVDNGSVEFSVLEQKYQIKKKNYFFALSSLLRHKNLNVLIELMEKIKENHISDVPQKLVLSGVSGEQKDEIEMKIRDKGLASCIILTGFITNEERNTLYKNAFAFLFPSVFEGFGMPVVEALMLGTNAITTKETSIPEASCGRAIYVDDPYNPDEWLNKIYYSKDIKPEKQCFPQYEKNNVASKYVKVFDEVFS